MAKKTGQGFRRGEQKDRSLFLNSKPGHWQDRNTVTGQITKVKADPDPFKGVRREKPK